MGAVVEQKLLSLAEHLLVSGINLNLLVALLEEEQEGIPFVQLVGFLFFWVRPQLVLFLLYQDLQMVKVGVAAGQTMARFVQQVCLQELQGPLV
jgi:hypothetical protein